jgi:hypothetical protein
VDRGRLVPHIHNLDTVPPRRHEDRVHVIAAEAEEVVDPLPLERAQQEIGAGHPGHWTLLLAKAVPF